METSQETKHERQLYVHQLMSMNACSIALFYHKESEMPHFALKILKSSLLSMSMGNAILMGKFCTHAPPFSPVSYKYTNSYLKYKMMKIEVIFFFLSWIFINRINNSVSCISFLTLKSSLETSLGGKKKKSISD